jgi:hypothetical protein
LEFPQQIPISPVKSLSFFLILALIVAAPPVRAQNAPDYLSFGAGGYDFDKDQGRRQSVDYRGEYQWSLSLLPAIGDYFVDLQLHPTVGIEGNSKGAFMGEGGLNLDTLLLHHIILTWGESVGAFDAGNDARQLGSVLEFRSQFEIGWQFDNKMRVTGTISHISNAGIAHQDPGAEILGAYLHIPLSGWSPE